MQQREPDADRLTYEDRALLTQIGHSLRAARLERGLTQKALGALAGIHEVHVSRLESGVLDARISTLHRIANALDVSLMSLLEP